MKIRYDISSNSVGFEEGGQVKFYNGQVTRRGHSLKLQQNLDGPHTVT